MALQPTLSRMSSLSGEVSRSSDHAGSAPLVLFADPLIETETKPLPASEERLVLSSDAGRQTPNASARHRFEEPVVAAGILADGSRIGDAVLLSRLIVRRCNMLLAVETALETLLDAGRHNVPREQLIEQFTRLVDSVRRWYLPAEQRVGRDVYQPIIGKLVNLPQGEPGSPFPPAAFVAQESAALNRRRVALLESQFSLAEFIAARHPRIPGARTLRVEDRRGAR
jgi:hypothetical protein